MAAPGFEPGTCRVRSEPSVGRRLDGAPLAAQGGYARASTKRPDASRKEVFAASADGGADKPAATARASVAVAGGAGGETPFIGMWNAAAAEVHAKLGAAGTAGGFAHGAVSTGL